MSNQRAVGNRKHATLMIPQTLEIIVRLNKGKRCHVITTLYNAGKSSIIDKETGGPFVILYGIKWKCERTSAGICIESASIWTNGQGVAHIVYGNMFQRNNLDRAYSTVQKKKKNLTGPIVI